jgi:hypothetical protein
MAICDTTRTWLKPMRIPACRSRPRGALARALFQSGSEIDAGALQAGARPKSSPQTTARAKVKPNTGQSMAACKVKFVAAVGQQPGDGADSPSRHQHAERPAQDGEKQALGEQLPHHPEAARAQAQPHGYLAAASRGARQQQVGDIGAGDRQDQADHGHQHVDRLRILAA